MIEMIVGECDFSMPSNAHEALQSMHIRTLHPRATRVMCWSSPSEAFSRSLGTTMGVDGGSLCLQRLVWRYRLTGMC